MLINEGTSVSMPAISEIKQTKWTAQKATAFWLDKAAQRQDASKEGEFTALALRYPSSLSEEDSPLQRQRASDVHTT